MTQPIRGDVPVVERNDRIQLFTSDGAVNVTLIGANSVPREGETVDFGAGELFVVRHVRWQVQLSAGTFSGGAVTARVLLAPTTDTVTG